MTKLFEVDELEVALSHSPGAIRLRPLKFTDAPQLLAVAAANHGALAPWLSWAQKMPVLEDMEGFLRHCEKAQTSQEERHFGILLDEMLIGVLGCGPIDWGNRSITIGYWLAQEHWGKGIVSTSLRTLTSLLLRSAQFERVEIRSAVENSRGNRVPKLAGFKHEGLLRRAQRVGDVYHDLNIFSLIRSDLSTHSS